MPAELIHQKCTSLQERVSAIETLLNGKTFITGAPVQTENGYDLGYVQVTLGEDGKLTTSREQTISINHGKTPEFNVTVGPDPENPNNGKIYWLINGKPMLDASGNPVEAPKDGKDAPEPTFHIWDGVLCYTFDQNPDLTDRSKNTWYELQNVIGPQGPVGPQGPSGLSITTDENGKVTITYDHDANPDTPAQTAELPTYASFMLLYDQVQRIQANIDGISTLVGLITGNKEADGNITGGQEFITDYRPIVDANGIITGFQFQTVKYVKNAEGNFEVVASGVKTVNGLDGKLIKLIQDENDGKYYWVLPDGTKLPVKGEDGADAAQPMFCIVNGHLWYTLDENPGEVGAEGHKWQDLGSVAALLKEGNTDTNKSLVTITRKPATDGKNEVLAFTFGTGENPVIIEVPTQGAFEDLIKRVAALETNSTNLQNMISAIDGRVAGLEGWLKGMKFVDSYELIKDQSGKLVKGFKVKFVTYEAVVDGNTVTYNKKAQTETVEYTDDGLLSLYYDETAGEWYWVFGQDNMIPVKAFKPIFQIHEGHIYASLKKTEELTKPYDFTKTAEWEDLGAVEPELGTTGQVLVGVTEDTEYVHFTFKDKNGNETTLSLPKKDTFLALQEQVNTANSNITALQTLVHEIDTRLTTVEGDVTILKGYTHVTGYEADIDKNQIKGYTISFSNGKSIYLGNGLTPQIGIKQHTDGKFYWTVDGEFIQASTGTGTTYVEAVGPKGEDGVTPIVKISDDGYWVISYDGQNFEQLKVNGEPVKARGDKGDQGDSMFAKTPIEEVDIDNDGTADKLIIKLADGSKQFEFPTWAAFEALKNKVDAINTTVEAFSDILNGTKFIQNITSFEDKNTDGVVIATGYELTYVEYTAAGLSAPKTERIYNGSVVGIKLDPSNNKYYWTINGTWLYDGNGNKVLAAGEQGVQGEPGADAPIPQFSINEKGELIVTVGDQVTNLGDVTGETGKDGAVNITWDGKENTVNPVAAKDADYIYIQYGPATEDVIQVPTRKAFDALQARVGNLESDVTALKELVADNTFVQDINYMKDAEGKIIGFKATVAQYGLSNGKYTATSVKEITYRDDQITAVKEGNDWYWVIKDADGNQIARFKLTGSDFTPVIKYYNGHLYVSNTPEAGNIESDLVDPDKKNYWTDLGQITPSNGTAGTTLKSVVEADGYITLTFVVGKDENGEQTTTMVIPNKVTFEALAARVSTIEGNIDALATLINEETYIKNIVPTTDPTTGKVIGFKAEVVKKSFVKNSNGQYSVSTENLPDITYAYDQISLVKNANGVWVWRVWIGPNEYEDLEADGSYEAVFVPKVGLYNGNIYVSNNISAGKIEDDMLNNETAAYWTLVGQVTPLEAGKAGNTLLSIEQVNDQNSGEPWKVVFTYKDGTKMEVPTLAAFNALAGRVDALEDNFGALKTLAESDTFVQKIEYMTDPATKERIGFTATIGKYVFNEATGRFEMAADYPETITYRDDQISVRKDADGNYWWVIKDADGNVLTEVKLTGSDFVPKVEYYNGHLYVSNSPNAGDIEKDLAGSTSTDVTKGYWTDLGQITPSNGTDGVTLESVAEGTGEDAGYIVMTFVTGKDASGNKTYQTMKVPTKATFDALVTRVATLEANVDALETLVAESTFVKNITTKTTTDSNGYEYVNGFDAVMVKYQKVNGVWTEVSDGTYPKTITYTDDKITLVKNAETGAWEWKIKTNDADGATTITLPASGGAPRFELFEGRIYVAIDPRATTPKTDLANDSTEGYWRDLGLLNPGANVDGGAGNSLLSVDTNDNGTEVTFKFTDGTTIVVPTQSAFAALNASVAQLNDDVEALQVIVNTIQEEDYVTRYEELKEDTANPNTVTGIRLHFKKGGSVDIDYGKDGVAPEIGVTYGEDGILYWTIGGQPLYYPGTTNPVPASYPTPIFDVTEDGELKVSYNNGTSWDSLGKVVGEQGDSMFKNVELSEDGMFILVTLSDDVEYKLPIWQDLVLQVNATNVSTFTPGSTQAVPFTITGPLADGALPEIATIAEGKWIADVRIEGATTSKVTGKILITAPSTPEDLAKGKVIVFASLHGQTVMKVINVSANSSFVQGGATVGGSNIELDNNNTLVVDYKRQEMRVRFNTTAVDSQTQYASEYSLVASYDGGAETDWILENNAPLTRSTEVYNDLVILPNTSTADRSATISVIKNGSTGAVCTFKIKQTGVDIDLTPTSDSYANCFVVSKAGSYVFSAYDRAGNRIGNIASREVIKDYGTSLSSQNISVYDDADLPNGIVIFEILDNYFVNGNAVIAAKDPSGTIVWSWHIWMRSALGNVSSNTMMDMNLGALSAGGEGLYYQWGRKDPLTSDAVSSTGGTVQNGIENPTVFYEDWLDVDDVNYWASDTYNPCPSGYTVPATSDWAINNTGTRRNDTPAEINGLDYYYSGFLYPGVGLISSSGTGYLWSSSNVAEGGAYALTFNRIQSGGTWFLDPVVYRDNTGTTSVVNSGNDQVNITKSFGMNIRCIKE